MSPRKRISDKPLDLTESDLQSLWRTKQADVWSFYCPMCRAPRKLPFRPQPWNPKYLFQIGVTTAFVTLVFWPLLDWKGIVSFLPLWSGFEIFYRIRMRAKANCPHCGFDPILFMADEDRAKREVEAYWRKKLGDKFPEKTDELELTRKKEPVRPEQAPIN